MQRRIQHSSYTDAEIGAKESVKKKHGQPWKRTFPCFDPIVTPRSDEIPINLRKSYIVFVWLNSVETESSIYREVGKSQPTIGKWCAVRNSRGETHHGEIYEENRVCHWRTEDRKRRGVRRPRCAIRLLISRELVPLSACETVIGYSDNTRKEGSFNVLAERPLC